MEVLEESICCMNLLRAGGQKEQVYQEVADKNELGSPICRR